MTHPNNNNDVPRLDTPLLTPAEAAELLAVRPSWIYEAVRAGTLPCLRRGATFASPGRSSRTGCAGGWRKKDGRESGGALSARIAPLRFAHCDSAGLVARTAPRRPNRHSAGRFA
jgi:excisionase family DNA binding protein